MTKIEMIGHLARVATLLSVGTSSGDETEILELLQDIIEKRLKSTKYESYNDEEDETEF